MKLNSKVSKQKRRRQKAGPSDPARYRHSEPPSRKWQTMRRIPEADRQPHEPRPQFPGEWLCGEAYENNVYYCRVDRFADGFFIGNQPYAIIGISSIDETARHDWRDFQRIKNDVCGEEWEAVELYPAESRLTDPSNRFFLWCVPSGVLGFGMRQRIVEPYGGTGCPPQRNWRRE